MALPLRISESKEILELLRIGFGNVCVPAAKGLLIPIGSEVYALMDDLFVLTVSTVPSASGPWTTSEALNELSKIDCSLFPSNERILYDSISARLSDDSDTWLSLKFEVSPEVYTHACSVLEVVVDGAYTMFDEYTAPLMFTAPSGDYDVITTLNLGCEYSFSWSPAPVKAFVDVAGVNSSKRGFDLQVSLGASISYSLVLI